MIYLSSSKGTANKKNNLKGINKMRKNFWTKKNVEKMNHDELVTWFTKCQDQLQKAARLEVEIPATDKAFKLLTIEMNKRGIR
jgi:hypothetical protein